MSSTCHVSFLATPDTDHKHKFSFTFLTHLSDNLTNTHQTFGTRSNLPCKVPQQSGESTQSPSITQDGWIVLLVRRERWSDQLCRVRFRRQTASCFFEECWREPNLVHDIHFSCRVQRRCYKLEVGVEMSWVCDSVSLTASSGPTSSSSGERSLHVTGLVSKVLFQLSAHTVDGAEHRANNAVMQLSPAYSSRCGTDWWSIGSPYAQEGTEYCAHDSGRMPFAIQSMQSRSWSEHTFRSRWLRRSRGQACTYDHPCTRELGWPCRKIHQAWSVDSTIVGTRMVLASTVLLMYLWASQCTVTDPRCLFNLTDPMVGSTTDALEPNSLSLGSGSGLTSAQEEKSMVTIETDAAVQDTANGNEPIVLGLGMALENTGLIWASRATADSDALIPQFSIQRWKRDRFVSVSVSSSSLFSLSVRLTVSRPPERREGVFQAQTCVYKCSKSVLHLCSHCADIVLLFDSHTMCWFFFGLLSRMRETVQNRISPNDPHRKWGQWLT